MGMGSRSAWGGCGWGVGVDMGWVWGLYRVGVGMRWVWVWGWGLYRVAVGMGWVGGRGGCGDGVCMGCVGYRVCARGARRAGRSPPHSGAVGAVGSRPPISCSPNRPPRTALPLRPRRYFGTWEGRADPMERLRGRGGNSGNGAARECGDVPTATLCPQPSRPYSSPVPIAIPAP